jgi:predicted HTH transcriptional regulator
MTHEGTKYTLNIEVNIQQSAPVPLPYTHDDCVKVLKAIEPGERVSTAQVAERTGLPWYTALRRLNDLIREGKLQKIGKSYKARYQV